MGARAAQGVLRRAHAGPSPCRVRGVVLAAAACCLLAWARLARRRSAPAGLSELVGADAVRYCLVRQSCDLSCVVGATACAVQCSYARVLLGEHLPVRKMSAQKHAWASSCFWHNSRG